MRARVIKGIKEGFSPFIILVIIAIILNFLNLDIDYNRFWTYLGKFEIINIFEEKALNGLVILAGLIGLAVFILSLIFPDNESEN